MAQFHPLAVNGKCRTRPPTFEHEVAHFHPLAFNGKCRTRPPTRFNSDSCERIVHPTTKPKTKNTNTCSELRPTRSGRERHRNRWTHLFGSTHQDGRGTATIGPICFDRAHQDGRGTATVGPHLFLGRIGLTLFNWKHNFSICL